ncbi:MAG: S8 family serine peptidase [Saccharospirillum sp.]|nr:S8 family serine peptidase [Saccharospirillum sp.]
MRTSLKLLTVSLSALALAGCNEMGASDRLTADGNNAAADVDANQNKQQPPTDRYIIKFDERDSQMLRRNGTFSTRSAENVLARAAGAKSIMHLSGLQASVATLTDEQKALLEQDPSVAFIEPDPVRYPQDLPSLMSEQSPYGIAMVQADQLSDAATGNRTVCIIDSGYDINHQDLPNTGVTGGNTSQYAGPWDNDGDGHGTHVAGTIAALGGNGVGVVGVNPSGLLNLHIVKVFNDNGNWAWGSDLVRAIEQCADNGAQVVNMSLGGGGSSQSERQAMQNFYENGVLLVAAAGNSGTSAYSYPASYDSVMSVAAIDRNRNRASFSQYNNQVEISAPGVNVLSTLPGNRYQAYNGTSMASPHVAGVAALVWSHFPQCSASEVRSALTTSAMDLGSAGWNTQYGYGLVQAVGAYNTLQQQPCGSNGEQPPSVIDLQNGETLSNLSAQAGTFGDVTYRLAVPEGATDLSIQINGGSGDADLYVRFGEEPTKTAYDCRPYRWGNNESCSFSQPRSGDWYIMLDAYDTYQDVNLSVSFEKPTAPGYRVEYDNLSGNRDQWVTEWEGQVFSIDVEEGDTSLTVNIARGQGDADLYVRHGEQPTRRLFDCRPFEDGNEEQCHFEGDELVPGTWYIGLYGFEAFSGVSLIIDRQ